MDKLGKSITFLLSPFFKYAMVKIVSYKTLLEEEIEDTENQKGE